MTHLKDAGEAEVNIQNLLINLILKINTKVDPNFHFDLCRLSITILDVCGS